LKLEFKVSLDAEKVAHMLGLYMNCMYVVECLGLIGRLALKRPSRIAFITSW
jgi:hypothetical protein